MRRALAILIAVLFVATGFSVLTGSAADAAPSVDTRLGQGECALTGRVWIAGRGCARHYCVKGAKIFKGGHDAELCELPGPKGSLFAQPINAQLCGHLGRVWIGQVNSCASNPDRARVVIANAPQCTGSGKTYVDHRELEGWYDECLSPGKVAKLSRIARRQKQSINEAALDRNRYNCSYRGGWEMRSGTCVKRVGPVPASQEGGFLMVGDSVSWRAENELYARVKDRNWVLDLRPGRRLDELSGRLDWFRANHGDPDDVIIELGTNRRSGFNEGDFRATIATIPATTPILFLLPYRKFEGDNAGPVKATKKYGRWIRALAAGRPQTCVSDWPKIASSHLSNLVDGEHPDNTHEDWYARYAIRAWATCSRQLGI